MKTLGFTFYYITPYIAVIVFVGGIILQATRWRSKQPVPATLSLFPRPKGKVEAGKKSYTTHRVKIKTEMGCLLHYQVIDTANGRAIKSGAIDAADSDEIDFINWDRYDGVHPSELRIKDGDTFKGLSSSDRAVIDARSTYRTEEDMLRWGARKIGADLARELVEVLTHYSPHGE